MIDIHSHIMPGVDDGAVDIYETVQMLKMAAESGVTGIIATPHCNIPGLYDNYFGKGYISKFNEMQTAIEREGIAIQVFPGMEVFGTEQVPDLLVEGMIMPLNQTRYVLVEFAFDEDPRFAHYLLGKMKEVGAIPVIAHAERYDFVQDNPQIIYKWRRKGYLIQINKGSFFGRFGNEPRRTAFQLLSHNLVNAVASDAHGVEQRTTDMKVEYEQLYKQRGRDYIDSLFITNPEHILAGQPVVKRDLIPFSKYEL